MNLFWWLKPRINKRSTVSSNTVFAIRSAWVGVSEALISKTPSQLRQALITADKCVDNALRDVVSGETMGERLKNAKDKFDYPVYDSIWRAHKVRNSMVHETSFEPSYSLLISSINDLKRGLQSLGVYID